MKFRELFHEKHTVLPVILVNSVAQAVQNARKAADVGANGVFLIDHGKRTPHLLSCYEAVKAKLPDLWVGLNCIQLGRSALSVIPADTDGLWVDDAGVYDTESGVEGAVKFSRQRRHNAWKGLYFGGVAFKHQKPVLDVGVVAKLAVPFTDVIVTSGPETGTPPTVDKIRKMRQAIDTHPLAIASGVSRENIQDFMPYVDCFLVATGVSDSFYELNTKKLEALLDLAYV